VFYSSISILFSNMMFTVQENDAWKQRIAREEQTARTYQNRYHEFIEDWQSSSNETAIAPPPLLDAKPQEDNAVWVQEHLEGLTAEQASEFLSQLQSPALCEPSISDTNPKDPQFSFSSSAPASILAWYPPPTSSAPDRCGTPQYIPNNLPSSVSTRLMTPGRSCTSRGRESTIANCARTSMSHTPVCRPLTSNGESSKRPFTSARSSDLFASAACSTPTSATALSPAFAASLRPPSTPMTAASLFSDPSHSNRPGTQSSRFARQDEFTAPTEVKYVPRFSKKRDAITQWKEDLLRKKVYI